ncbi:predicted GPI-anchored protein 58 isoform X3 [Bubalus bubalis]|uniref:predicted GPI-anchored protein 58 isoform X3 n=1 Tax=Bubalus bubalis TaxID=89462 RepID=UPI001D1133C0|nr:predicted GPI-anchored protein 58 isoform X3 [Bubalus bubalis]
MRRKVAPARTRRPGPVLAPPPPPNARWRQGNQGAPVPSRPRAVGAAAPDLDSAPGGLPGRGTERRPAAASPQAPAPSPPSPGSVVPTSRVPAALEDSRSTARSGERAPKATRRRPAPGQAQCVCRPLHPARDTKLREEDLLQRGLSTRPPPRGRRRPQPHPPATSELLPQPTQKLGRTWKWKCFWKKC